MHLTVRGIEGLREVGLLTVEQPTVRDVEATGMLGYAWKKWKAEVSADDGQARVRGGRGAGIPLPKLGETLRLRMPRSTRR